MGIVSYTRSHQEEANEGPTGLRYPLLLMLSAVFGLGCDVWKWMGKGTLVASKTPRYLGLSQVEIGNGNGAAMFRLWGRGSEFWLLSNKHMTAET